MRTQVTYSFDPDDAGPLCPERVEEALSLLSGSVDPASKRAAEEGQRDAADLGLPDVDGLRAARKIRGNAFTAGDVSAFHGLVASLAGRHRESAAELEAAGAAPAFVSGVRATADLAERITAEFVAAWEAARSA